MDRHDISETTVRHVLPRLGVRHVNVPGIGFRIYGPDIEAMHWDAVAPLVQKMHDDRHTLVQGKGARTHAKKGT